MSLHIFYSEDMGKTRFPRACINQNQLNQFCVNERKRERERKGEVRKEGRKGEERRERLSTKTLTCGGEKKRIPYQSGNIQGALNISSEIMHHFISFYFRTKI